MEIAIVTYYGLPQIGGIANYTHQLIEGLSINNKVYVIQPKNLKQYTHSLNLFGDVPLPKCSTYLNVIKIIIWYLKNKPKLDVVHATELGSCYPAYILAKLTKAKLIITFHGNDFIHMQSIKYKRALFKIISKHAYKIITVSNSNKNMFLPKYPLFKCKIKIINPGVGINFYNENLNWNPRLILSISKLRPLKGIDTMIKAMDYLPEYSYLVVGSGPDEERLKELAKGKNVKFEPGTLDQNKLRRYYNQAGIFVLPSRFALEGYTESFGMVFLESMACGTPCVSYNLGGIPEAFGQNTGILLNQYDPKSLAEAIKKINKQNMQLDCIKWADSFRWDKQIKRIENEYK